VFQAAVIGVIVWLSRAIEDPVTPDPDRPFDLVGTILSAVGLVLIVTGVLAADDDLVLTLVLVVLGAAVLGGCWWHIRARERKGRDALLSTALFRNRVSNLGMVTQNVQWLLLMGTSFVVSAYLQVVRGYNAIQTGVIFTAATGGILAASLAAARMAKRFPQRAIIMAGVVTTIVGIVVLIAFVNNTDTAWAFAPGLLLIGLGVGAMLTPSVNVVQSAFPETQQGEISGLSRCVSNLGSSLGTAVAGTILVAGLDKGAYAAAMIVLAVIALGGLAAALRLPRANV
jgi:Na+/melibiose symporter-like transporter